MAGWIQKQIYFLNCLFCLNVKIYLKKIAIYTIFCTDEFTDVDMSKFNWLVLLFFFFLYPKSNGIFPINILYM